jgi:hypothetical protein
MTYETEKPVEIPDAMKLAMQLEAIFMPYATKERRKLYEPTNFQAAKFVHYTTAEAALGIIASKRLWMRNTTCMADYREVQHGFSMLHRFFADESKRNTFTAALDACHPGAASEAIKLFNEWWGDLQSQTFIASISVHDDKTEDQHGRLSMWRAFGGSNPRVAIVFRAPWYSGATAGLNVIFSPVAYFSDTQVQDEIYSVIKNINDHADFVRATDRVQVVRTVFAMLVAGVVCLKHEGFHEEREWRVIYGPKRNPSPIMEAETETKTIGGVPQLIYKMPLDATVAPEVAGLDVARIFDRLIIGPSQYSLAMHQAFAAALTNAGIADASARVVFSGIPIRA